MKDPFNPEVDIDPKHQQRIRVAKAIEIRLGRPASDAKERNKRAALTAVSIGDAPADVTRAYGVTQAALARYMKQVFPTDEDRYEFLESCLLTNASLAGDKFVEKFGEMTAPEAAKAMSTFAMTAVHVKKAREAGFKDAPINVGIILRLQDTLTKLASPPVEED